MTYWQGRCPLTGITDPALLRASHIVPWRDCTGDAQRLDVHNGLLLSALWDAAFDRGLVTFADAGHPEFSPALSGAAHSELRWKASLSLTSRQRENLAWHREHAFNVSGSRDASQNQSNNFDQ
jgi:predicted restriction endonuclease